MKIVLQKLESPCLSRRLKTRRNTICVPLSIYGDYMNSYFLNKIKNVYNDVTIRNDLFMSAFCCDFKLIEEKSKQWTVL